MQIVFGLVEVSGAQAIKLSRCGAEEGSLAGRGKRPRFNAKLGILRDHL